LLLSGRDVNGKPATGHRHVSFLLCGTNEAPSRLCAWRAEPFNDAEQRAMLDAASTALPLNYKDDPWTLTLVPLDKLVPPPPGLTCTAHREWKSLSPYVPPRHVYGRSGKQKPECSVQDQIMEELAGRGFDLAGLTATFERSGWVKIHGFKSAEGERRNTDKLGYTVKLSFREPTQGPISLGASSHFGLGLFVPAAAER
jgi:CRISPR-associated protein Csb2